MLYIFASVNSSTFSKGCSSAQHIPPLHDEDSLERHWTPNRHILPHINCLYANIKNRKIWNQSGECKLQVTWCGITSAVGQSRCTAKNALCEYNCLAIAGLSVVQSSKCVNGFVWVMTLKLATSFSPLSMIQENTLELGSFLENSCDDPQLLRCTFGRHYPLCNQFLQTIGWCYSDVYRIREHAPHLNQII